MRYLKRLLALIALTMLPTVASAQNANWYVPPWLQSNNTSGTILSGPLLLPDGTAAAPSLGRVGSTSSGFLFQNANSSAFTFSGVIRNVFSQGRISGDSDFTLSAPGSAASPDVFITRDAANTLALRNGGTAGTPVPQTFNVYNFCDGAACATGYERMTIEATATGTNFKQNKLGSGTDRSVTIFGGAGTQVYIGDGTTATWGSNLGGGSNRDWSPNGSDQRDLGTTGGLVRGLYLSRSIQGSKTKTLTDAVATQFVRVSIPQTMGSNYAGGNIVYTVYARDATTGTQALHGTAQFACINNAGTESCAAIIESAKTVAVVTGGTLTCAITAVTGLTDEVAFSANCDTSLTSTALTIQYRLDMPQPNTVTPQ